MTTGYKEAGDAYKSGSGGGGPDLGLVAVKIGDTPGYLNNKIYARPNAPVKINEVIPGADYWQLEIDNNLSAGAGISITQPDPAGPLIITNTDPGVPGVESVVAGAGISVDNTDPANPIITNTSPAGGQVDSVVAGAGIAVDSTDPANPIVSSTGSGPGAVAGVISMPLATCRNGVAIPGVNNAGALLATLTALTADVTITKLGIWIKQIGGGLLTLGIYNTAGVLLARTASFPPTPIGYKEMPIVLDGSGGAITEIALTGNQNYYLAVHGNSSTTGAQFYGQDVGTTFGPSPWLGWGKDNIATMPNSISGGSENAQRFMMVARL